MTPARLKTGYFLLAGLNSFATVYYTYYLYFFTQSTFGFDNKANLMLAAFNGLLYMAGSFWGGRFAQRFGYFTALKLGFVIMIGAMLAGPHVTRAGGQVLVMTVMVLGMCFTWPSFEALVTEGETPAGVQHMVGVYNVVWAGTGALAYFVGGSILENHPQRLFHLPLIVHLGQLLLTFWLERQAGRIEPITTLTGTGSETAPSLNPRPIANARLFLRLSWLSNPFAYIAINTLIAVMPGVAAKLALSTMAAGFCCSIWCFARLGSFVGLWFWSGWHYRFKWLLAGYLVMVTAFTVIVLAPSLAALILAQVIFGIAIGLIYYSSLFYSMDLSQSKGEHGGIHEAAIGLGNFAGPAVGAASLHFLPQQAGSATLAVSMLLLCGLVALLVIRRNSSQ